MATTKKAAAPAKKQVTKVIAIKTDKPSPEIKQFTKELAAFESKVLLKIKNEAEFDKATATLAAIVAKGKEAKAAAAKELDPLTEAMRQLKQGTSAVKERWDGVFSLQVKYESILRPALAAYISTKAAAKTTLDNQLQSGTITLKAHEKKAGAIKTKGNGVHSRQVVKYRVADITKVPREFMVPDMDAIEASFKDGKPVKGCESYTDTVVSVR